MIDLSTTEPIDLTDLRAYLAMEPDDTSEDPLLTECIAFCRDRLESVLPYHIAEREVRTDKALCTWCLMPDTVMDLKGPVLEILDVTITVRGGDEVMVPMDYWWAYGCELHVDVPGAMSGITWDGDAPAPIGLTCVYVTGAHVPPVVKGALLMMCRSRYERRDEDPLTSDVMSMIYPETRPNI